MADQHPGASKAGELRKNTQKAKISQGKGGAASAPKKKSSAGLFISILCLLIVILCLVPVILGGNFFSDDNDPKNIARTSSLSDQSSTPDYGRTIILDEGALAEPIPTGVDADTPDPTTRRSLTISGEELNQIEANFKKQASEQRSAEPASAPIPPLPQPEDQTPEQPVQSQNPAPAPAPAPTAEPAPVTPAQAEKPQEPGTQPPKEAAPQPVAQSAPAQGKLERSDSLVRSMGVMPASAVQTSPSIRGNAPAQNNNAQGLAASQGRAGDNSSRARRANETPKPESPATAASGIVRADQVPFTGQAVPGGSLELQDKNEAHFTVQVVAGRNRQSVIDVSAALSERYWVYETTMDGRPWYVLICGDYPSRQSALEAIARLPAAIKQARPFVKSFATVKDEIANPF